MAEALGGGSMTLSAITSDFFLISPQARINAGEPELTVARFVRIMQNESGLYCPHCHRVMGDLIPVRFRHCTDRSSHFYHHKDSSAQSECVSYRPETEKHLNAKAAIAESIKLSRQTAYEQVEVTVDRFRLQGEDASDRKPDILVIYKNGSKEAHEVQISSIEHPELAQRTVDLKVNHGCDRVVWYLYGKAYNYLNRKWLSDNGVEHYRLTFQRDEDGTYPEWVLASAPEEPKPRNSNQDKCSSTRKEERERRSQKFQEIREKIQADCELKQKLHEEYLRDPSSASPQARAVAVQIERERFQERAIEKERQKRESVRLQKQSERQRGAEILKSHELDLYRWFIHGFKCPTEPFNLKDCQRVTDPAKWYPIMRSEVSESLRFLDGEIPKPPPRHYTGALQAEIAILRDRYGVSP